MPLFRSPKSSKRTSSRPGKQEPAIRKKAAAPARSAGAAPLCSYPDFVICKTGIVCFVRASVIFSPPFLYCLRELKVNVPAPLLSTIGVGSDN